MTRWLSFAQWACLVLLLAGAANMSGLAAGGEADMESRTAGRSTEGHRRDTDEGRGQLASRSLDVPPAASPCPAVQKAVGYYRRKYTASRERMGLEGAPPREWYPCASARRRAKVWRARAHTAALELARYQREWAAPPEPFLSIARCENRGNGLYGVNWDAYNSVYEGAYGFLHSTWDGYKPAGYPASASTATIRQQTEVAKILARTFGGYSSWPACHIRLGLPG